jgi:hypothetical protein
VAAVVAHHALRLTGGAGGVEDVQRVRRGDRYAVRRNDIGDRLRPVQVAAGDQLRELLLALQDDAAVRLVGRLLDGVVEQGLVGHDAVRLDAAGAGDHDLGLGVVDAGRQLAGGEAAEDHGMHGADPGTSEHRHRRLRHHRHIDDDPVPLDHAEVPQRTGEAGDPLLQLRVGDVLDRPGHRAVVDDGGLFAPALGNVSVQGVVAGVEFGAGEPAIQGRVAVVQDLVPGLDPIHRGGGLRPKSLGRRHRAIVGLTPGSGSPGARCHRVVAHAPLRLWCCGALEGAFVLATEEGTAGPISGQLIVTIAAPADQERHQAREQRREHEPGERITEDAEH